jgi:hypothetical protein
VRSERRVGVGLAEGVDAGRLQASDPHGQVQRRAGKPGGDQHGRRNAGGEDLRRRTDSPAAAFGGNSGEARVRGSIAGLPKLPGGEAELLRGLAGAVVQRGGRSTVEQGA